MRTATYSKTATRLQLLEVNLRVAVHRLHRDPERFIRRVLEPCTRQKLLRRLVFLGLDDREIVQAHLALAVDWSEHERLGGGEARLHVDGRWVEQGAAEVRELLLKFEEAVAEKELRIELELYLRSGAETAELRRSLGLRPARQRRWAGHLAKISWPLQKLPELTVTLELAVEDRQDE